MSQRFVALLLFATVLGATQILAHNGDPKGKPSKPVYAPAYRRAGPGPIPFNPPGFPSHNVELESWLPLNEFADNLPNGSDCWGYVSASGREYALFCHFRGMAVVEITNPGNAQIVDQIDGPWSLWRDVKVYENHAYVVNENTGGIQVIDLSQVDNGVVTEVGSVTSGGTQATHNVAIDEESGFLYRCGGRDNGLRIYSLANPAAPEFVGSWSDRYVHDAQVVTYPNGREIAFCCAGFNGGWLQPGLDIVDVTDKQNPFLVSRTPYQNGQYSHQAWLTEDRQYLYLNDELDEGTGIPSTTIVFDVNSLNTPLEVAVFDNGNPAVGHNLYVRGDFVFEANYRSGLRVFDIENRLNPTEVAFFDTFPANDQPEFEGLWSVYPLFPSGTVIGSDRNRGLFVWDVDTSAPPLPPVAGFTLSNQSGGAPLTVSFANTSTGAIDSYSWDFGDGGSSSEIDPTHTYNAPGTYSVSLTVTGPGGSDTHTGVDVVDVDPSVHFLRFEDGVALASSFYFADILATSPAFLSAFSASVAYPTDLLDGFSVDITGSVTEANGAEFVDTHVDDGTGAMTIEVIMDEPPLNGNSLPAGDDQKLAQLVFGVGSAFSDGDVRQIGFENEIGSNPVTNRFVDLGGTEILPALVPATITFYDQVVFIRSDCDGSGGTNLGDPILLLGVLFSGTEAPACVKACDFDDTGVLNLADAVLTLQLLFQQGAPPPPPFPLAGPDPTPDPLGCD